MPDTRTERLVLLVTSQDKERIEAAAEREHLSFSTWALRVLLAAAKKS